MPNRTVTALTAHAEEVAQALGGFINGTAWINPIDNRSRICITVENRDSTLKTLPAFKRLKREGKITNWAAA